MRAAWLDWAQDADGQDKGDVGTGGSSSGARGGGGEGRANASGRHPANEWALFLEDDVDWHPEVKGRRDVIAVALGRGLQLAQRDGLAMLGWCEPQYGQLDFWHSQDVVVRRGNGMCAHAMALTRWRAAILADELALFKTQDPDKDVHIDILLRAWVRKGEGAGFGSWGGVYLLGANLTISSAPLDTPGPPTRMAGLLYQV
jgi:hypothetical protein